MGIVEVGRHLEPALGLVFHVAARRETLEVGVLHRATVLEVAKVAIVRHLVGTSVQAEVVLLAERRVVDGIVVVVWQIGVLAIAIAELGVRVELEVGADEVLACGHGVDLVAKAAVVGVEEVLASIVVSLLRGLAMEIL